MLVVGLGESNFSSLSPELLEKYMNVYKQPEMFIRINQEMRVFPIVQEGKETADRLANETVQVISDNGYDGYVKASPKQIAETKEAYSIMIRSGDDYTIRRALMDISNSRSNCAARAQGLIQQLDSFYLKQETPHYTIYQLSFDKENVRDYSFRSYDELQKAGLHVDAQNYACVYSGRMPDSATLDTLYEKFNLHRPKDFTGHSMSVSDVIVMTEQGKNQAYYVDSFGFANVPEFLESSQRAQEKVEEKSTTQSRLSDSKAKASVLSKLQEKKAQAAELNKKKEKPEKSKGLDLS